MVILKTKEEINILDAANKITSQILDEVQNNIKPGITTQELNNIAEKAATGLGVICAFKNYKSFPAALCISIGSEIVHGIPGNRIIKDGDVVSIDFGIIFEGYFGDQARTIIVGQAEDNVRKLVEDTKLALFAGIEQMKVGNRLYDICGAIENIAKINKYGNLKYYGGHGIGQHTLHEEPFVPNYIGLNIPNIRLQDGLVLALEPMFTLGNGNTKVSGDGWTVVSADNSVAAHWELSVAIQDGKPFILGQS